MAKGSGEKIIISDPWQNPARGRLFGGKVQNFEPRKDQYWGAGGKVFKYHDKQPGGGSLKK